MDSRDYKEKLDKWEAEGYEVSELRRKWFPPRKRNVTMWLSIVMAFVIVGLGVVIWQLMQTPEQVTITTPALAPTPVTITTIPPTTTTTPTTAAPPSTTAAPTPAPAPTPTSPPASTVPESNMPLVLIMASASAGDYTYPEQAFADEFNARCGPDYTIEYYSGGSLITMPDLLGGVSSGVADIAALIPSHYSSDEPLLIAAELPFLFNNPEAHSYAVPDLKSVYDEIFINRFNQKLLCLHNICGMAVLSTKPIGTLEDWDGLKVLTLSPDAASVVEALGGVPVAVSLGDSYAVLERGLVDAAIVRPTLINVLSLTEICNYVTAVYIISTVQVFSINLDTWDELPPDIQDIMLEEAWKQSDATSEQQIHEWYDNLDIMVEEGLEIIYPSEEELMLWKIVCQPIYEEFMALDESLSNEVITIAEESNVIYPY